MSGLSLEQIAARINEEFGDTDDQQLVFWYDDSGSFAEDVDSLQLKNAQVLHLEKDDQFKTKYFLLKQDTKTNYLLYAPFPKPSPSENHLEDMLLYSSRFYADQVSLIAETLKLNESMKLFLKEHIAFFQNKERFKRFVALKIEEYTDRRILTGMMCCLARVKSCNFEDLARELIIEFADGDNRKFSELAKFNLIPAFWEKCTRHFGYESEEPSLKGLAVALFVSEFRNSIRGELIDSWQPYLTSKPGNTISFLDSIRNNVNYQEAYRKLSDMVEEELDIQVNIKSYPTEALTDCTLFPVVDRVISSWLIERLLAEDLSARLGKLSIIEICNIRLRMPYSLVYRDVYEMIMNAYVVLQAAEYTCSGSLLDIAMQYKVKDYQIDMAYRHFYAAFDKLGKYEDYVELRQLVENVYTNVYLATLLPAWNKAITEAGAVKKLPPQRRFFEDKIRNINERTVVIISDALRYEVAYELFSKLNDNAKCQCSLDMMISTLPSYTRLGMEALLPHNTLELTVDGKELIDGEYCTDLASREKMLQKHIENSACLQYSDIRNNKSRQVLRDLFTGKQVVYIYHDQIDMAGENSSEEVIGASSKAIEELKELIYLIAGNANTLRFIITADHGFIYKSDKVTESEKLAKVTSKGKIMKRRYIVAKKPIEAEGVCSLPLSTFLDDKETRYVSFPLADCVFKVPGNSGLNYVHGGSSPQELLVPVLDVKVQKSRRDTGIVSIDLVSIVDTITNMVTTLDFVQREAVNELMKRTVYKVYFQTEDNERISNDCIYDADKREAETTKRLFKLKFTFKDKVYDRSQRYYMVVYDVNNQKEAWRKQMLVAPIQG